MSKGDSALGFKIDPTVDNAWGITYLYGCVGLMISDPNFVIGTHTFLLFLYPLIPMHVPRDESGELSLSILSSIPFD